MKVRGKHASQCVLSQRQFLSEALKFQLKTPQYVVGLDAYSLNPNSFPHELFTQKCV